MGLPEVAEFARNFAVMVRVQGPVSFLISSHTRTHICLCICNSIRFSARISFKVNPLIFYVFIEFLDLL